MTALAAVAAIAVLTWRRLFRGRAVWASVAIALLPIAYAIAVRGREELGLPSDLFAFEQLLLVVLPSMFVASSIGEEIEDRTTTYLWSRPLPRWTVLAGKLAALAPIALALVLASWLVAGRIGLGSLPPARTSLALVAGGTAIACVAAGIAALVPRHGMALTITYFLLFDLPIGVLPASLRYLSITHHTRVIGAVGQGDDRATTAVIAIAIIALVWAIIGFVRIRRLEV